MDGISWLEDVQSIVDGTADSDDASCCDYRFIDIKNSRSIVTADYQYLWRADGQVETSGNVDTLYQCAYDEEQLYDLAADPDQQTNLIEDESLSSTISWFQSTMWDYLNATCPAEDGQCAMPSFTMTDDGEDDAMPSSTENDWVYQRNGNGNR